MLSSLTLAALASAALWAAPAPATRLHLLFTADNWGELAPCG